MHGHAALKQIKIRSSKSQHNSEMIIKRRAREKSDLPYPIKTWSLHLAHLNKDKELLSKKTFILSFNVLEGQWIKFALTDW